MDAIIGEFERDSLGHLPFFRMGGESKALELQYLISGEHYKLHLKVGKQKEVHRSNDEALPYGNLLLDV